jgi:hypothetical protein
MGPQVERVWGTYKTEICLTCFKWRKLDHYDVTKSKWLKEPMEDIVTDLDHKLIVE